MEKTERPHIMIAGNSTVNKDQQSAYPKIKMIAFNIALMKVIRLSLGFNLVSDLNAL